MTIAATKWFRQTIQQSTVASKSVLAVRARKDSNAALMANNRLNNLELGRIRVVSAIATVAAR